MLARRCEGVLIVALRRAARNPVEFHSADRDDCLGGPQPHCATIRNSELFRAPVLLGYRVLRATGYSQTIPSVPHIPIRSCAR